MKAIVCTKYGSADVLQLKEVEKPTPKDNEVLVKVFASSVTAADSMMRQGTPFYGRFFIGLMKPKNPITGTGFAGVIEAVGKEVRLFKIDDSVFGETGVGFSTNAEYVCLPDEGVLATLPNNMTFEEAAPICDGALTSLSFLKDIGKIQSGQRILQILSDIFIASLVACNLIFQKFFILDAHYTVFVLSVGILP